MNPILPKGFVFDSSKVLTPDRMDNDTFYNFASFAYHNKIESILILGALFLIFVIIAIIAVRSRTDSIWNFLLFAFSAGISILSICTIFSLMFLSSQFDNDCEFKFKPNSNLIVKQNVSDNDHDVHHVSIYLYDPKQENQPIFAHEKKAYPYKVYVKDNLSDKLVYLGQAKRDKKVLLNYETAAGRMFAIYCNYINTHHLNDKFTKTLKFERDPRLLNADGVPQYVLKGDGITLKVKSLQPQKYQVYAEKD